MREELPSTCRGASFSGRRPAGVLAGAVPMVLLRQIIAPPSLGEQGEKGKRVSGKDRTGMGFSKKNGKCYIEQPEPEGRRAEILRFH
jgi:hypothetical protein